jgi:hypothetical protein
MWLTDLAPRLLEAGVVACVVTDDEDFRDHLLIDGRWHLFPSGRLVRDDEDEHVDAEHDLAVVSITLRAIAAHAGLAWSGYVSAANTVTVRLCNVTGSPIDPASASWRCVVTRK